MDFDVHAYMKNNLDLITVYGIRDLSKYYYHYIQCGKEEGRIATAKDAPVFKNEIASFSTKYNTEEARAINVELASQRINGIVIQPGETFSFSNSIMSRTTENGYVMAPSFAAGKVVSSVEVEFVRYLLRCMSQCYCHLFRQHKDTLIHCRWIMFRRIGCGNC